MPGKIVKGCDGCSGFHQGQYVSHNHCYKYPYSDRMANGHTEPLDYANGETNKYWCNDSK